MLEVIVCRPISRLSPMSWYHSIYKLVDLSHGCQFPSNPVSYPICLFSPRFSRHHLSSAGDRSSRDLHSIVGWNVNLRAFSSPANRPSPSLFSSPSTVFLFLHLPVISMPSLFPRLLYPYSFVLKPARYFKPIHPLPPLCFISFSPSASFDSNPTFSRLVSLLDHSIFDY